MSPVRLSAMFVLLFPARVVPMFAGFDRPGDGIEQIPADEAQARIGQLNGVETVLLGRQYLESRRMRRWPLGRIRLAEPAGGGPDHADVFLVTHTSGAGLWESWIPSPAQPLDAGRYASWLQSDLVGTPAWALRERLVALDPAVAASGADDAAFPFSILRYAGDDLRLEEIVAQGGADLVRLLYLDRSPLAFKPGVVEEELGRDFCLHEGGLSLWSQRSALDLRVAEGFEAHGPLVLPPRSALPLLVTTELLLIESSVLRTFHERLLRADAPGSLSRLAEVKAQVLDALEEYRGTVAQSNRFSTEVTIYGQRVLGMDALYQALIERLEAVTFEITTRYQHTTNVLQFSFTVIFSALEAATLAAVIAAIRYTHDVAAVVAWATGVGLAAAMALAALLRRRMR